MACSPAQLASNRQNALKSTGPRTLEGKERSRANGLKHGLTGEGIVLPTEDAAEVDRRFTNLEIEMNPRNDLARQFVKRVALMTVKLDRSTDHEVKAISFRMRHAAEKFDDARLSEMDKAYSWIAHEPATHARRLRSSPEGLDRLIEVFESLKAEIVHPDGVQWKLQHCEQFHHLTGRRRVDFPVSRARAMTDATFGNFEHLRNADGAGLGKSDRQHWAVYQLVDLIDEQIAIHKKLREAIDTQMIDLDRSEAAGRAYFDDSKGAILARKYEAAAERGLYRALREFREVQAEAKDEAELLDRKRLEAEEIEHLGSSLPEPPEDATEETNVDPIVPEGDTEGPSGRSRDDRPTLVEASLEVFAGETPLVGPLDGGPERL